MYKKLKKQNGEKFAQTIRNFHNGILEIPDLDVILRHAGRDAEPLLPYLMSLLAANDDAPPAPASSDPFVLLDQAGYKAFYADTLDKQNSIKHYFKKDELLCTFNEASRYERYHIVHAVKKNVDDIRRRDFNGKEDRQDAYGTSVISIQMLKAGGFISIKNRYNHTVSGCDHTFNSNPDNIIDGLSVALRNHFNVEFTTQKSALPDGFVLMGNQIFKYHTEDNNIYFGDQSWAKDGAIHVVDRSVGNALFDGFLFDNETKTLKSIAGSDSFANDFNRFYGGNKNLTVDRNGNLTLNGDILIGAEHSRIKSLYLPAFTSMSNHSLGVVCALTHIDMPALVSIGNRCFYSVNALTHVNMPALISMGHSCLEYTSSLVSLEMPALISMGEDCLSEASVLTQLSMPALTSMEKGCFAGCHALTQLSMPSLTSMEEVCFHNTPSLKKLDMPALISTGRQAFANVPALTHVNIPVLTSMSSGSFYRADVLTQLDAPKLVSMGNHCLTNAHALKAFHAPMLESIGIDCFPSLYHRGRAIWNARRPITTTCKAIAASLRAWAP